MGSYSELLRNPRWQKKRLEILNRDEFTCQSCGATEKTLHVHHCYYEYGVMPWDYPNDSLLTLCFECHEDETAVFGNHFLKAGRDNLIVYQLASMGLTLSDIEYLAVILHHWHRRNNGNSRRVKDIVANALQGEVINAGVQD